MIITEELSKFIYGAYQEVPPEGVAVTIDAATGPHHTLVKIRLLKVVARKTAEYQQITTALEIHQRTHDDIVGYGRSRMAEALQELGKGRTISEPRESAPEPSR
jgi:hypothetical protein